MSAALHFGQNELNIVDPSYYKVHKDDARWASNISFQKSLNLQRNLDPFIIFAIHHSQGTELRGRKPDVCIRLKGKLVDHEHGEDLQLDQPENQISMSLKSNLKHLREAPPKTNVSAHKETRVLGTYPIQPLIPALNARLIMQLINNNPWSTTNIENSQIRIDPDIATTTRNALRAIPQEPVRVPSIRVFPPHTLKATRK